MELKRGSLQMGKLRGLILDARCHIRNALDIYRYEKSGGFMIGRSP